MILTRALWLLSLLASAGGVSHAQGVLRAELRDSNIVARNVVRRLFDGIPLSPRQESTATAIIKKTWRDQFLVPKTGSLAQQVQQGRRLNAERDSTLKALLTVELDREAFDRNARALAGGAAYRASGRTDQPTRVGSRDGIIRRDGKQPRPERR